MKKYLFCNTKEILQVQVNEHREKIVRRHFINNWNNFEMKMRYSPKKIIRFRSKTRDNNNNNSKKSAKQENENQKEQREKNLMIWGISFYKSANRSRELE